MTTHLPSFALAAAALLAVGCGSTVDATSLDLNGDSEQQSSGSGGDTHVTQPSGGDSAPADNGDTMMGGGDTTTTPPGDSDMTGGDTDPGTGGGSTPGIPRPAAIANAPYNTWKLNFHDEFDSLDTIAPDNQQLPGKNWYLNNEACCLSTTDGKGATWYPAQINGKTINPFSIDNGMLVITATVTDNTWMSGMFTGVDAHGNGFAQQYGYWEIRFELPQGPGTWPAFWLLDQNNKQTGQAGGEIDIIEQYGQFPTSMCSTLHDWRNASGNGAQKCATNPNDPQTGMPINWTTGMHTVAMLWTADTMTFYADDQVYFTTPTTDIMKMPYYIIIDLGIGGGWPTEQTPSPSVMKIDYVRVWGQ